MGRSKLAPLSIFCALSTTGCASSLASLVGGLGIGIGEAGADVAEIGGRSGLSNIERVKLAVVGKTWDETGMRGRTPSYVASPTGLGHRVERGSWAVARMELPWQR